MATTLELAIGDRVRIHAQSVTNVRMPDGSVTLERWRSPDPMPETYVIVRVNRHGDWTLRSERYGVTHDALRDDVVPADC